MERPLSLLDISEDILHLIVTLLPSTSLLPFAKVSKACHQVAVPVLYRSVTLKDDQPSDSYRRMVETLLDPTHSMSQHIRELTVSEFEYDSKLLNGAKLEMIIGNLQNLISFSWTTPAVIPISVISKLELLFPQCKLHVVNHRRDSYGHGAQESKLDKRLLSSPLLYSLSYSMAWAFVYRQSRRAEWLVSEFQIINEILSCSPNLKILDLGFYNRATLRTDLPTDLDERFIQDRAPDLPFDYEHPSLEGLTIPTENIYTGNPSAVKHLTSELLLASVKWTRVQRMKLFGVSPHYCFEQLNGRVPKFKALSLGLQLSSSDNYTPSEFRDITVVKNFISSITSLQHLRIKNYAANIGEIVPAVLRHQESLRTLVIHTPPDSRFTRSSPPVWSVSQLEQLLTFSKLSHLELDISPDDATWQSPPNPFSPLVDRLQSLTTHLRSPKSTSTRVIQRFTHLKSLKLWIELPFGATAFSDIYKYDGLYGSVRVPAVKFRAAGKAIMGLWRQIKKTGNGKTSLETLELCFVRIDIQDRMQGLAVQFPVKLTRLPSGKSIGDVDFSLECQQGWESGE